MQLGNGIYYSICSLKAQHISSGTSLIIVIVIIIIIISDLPLETC